MIKGKKVKIELEKITIAKLNNLSKSHVFGGNPDLVFKIENTEEYSCISEKTEIGPGSLDLENCLVVLPSFACNGQE